MDLDTLHFSADWLIRIGALLVVPQQRTPSATRAWLLLILFLPLPGLLLYLLIGRPRFPAWRLARFAALQPYFQATARALEPLCPAPGALGPQQEVAALARRYGELPAVGGNSIELIDVYDDLFDRLEADINAAERYVLILVYILADDRVGQRIAAALGRAVKRGVDARVIFDPVGTHAWRKGTLAMLQAQGVQVREALPWRLLHGSRGDMRNHRKLFVIDGHIGYAGSQNLVAKDFRPGVVNHELVARVSGPVVAEMEAVVRGDWSLESGQLPTQAPQPAAATGTAQLQLLPSGADFRTDHGRGDRIEGFESLLVWQVHRAERRVVLVTPYFIPDEDLLGALRTAAERGVEVHVVLSGVVDQKLVHLSQCSYYDNLLAAGVQIHLYRGFLLHAKNVGIDGRLAIVGSSNVDLRSFQLNQEASLLIHDAASVAKVDAIQAGYLAASDAVTLDAWRRRPPHRKFAENLARLFNSLL